MVGLAWLRKEELFTLACEDRLGVGVVMEVGSRLDFIRLPSSLRDP